MTQTTTIAISISPLGKLLQDYLSRHVFAQFLPSTNRENTLVLNYFEEVKLSKNNIVYFKLVFASLFVFSHSLISFLPPFPYLSSEQKLNALKELQNSRFLFVRNIFNLLKTHSLLSVFKTPPNVRPSKPTDKTYDFIVLGKEGQMTRDELYKDSKNVLLIENNQEIQKILFKRNRAVAVETDRGIFLAKEAVVSASGAIDTPALLLRSGLKNTQIGKNLNVYLGIDCLALLSEKRIQAEGKDQKIEISQFEKNGIFIYSNKLPLLDILCKMPLVRDEINFIIGKIENLTSWRATILAKTKGSIGITIKGKPILFFNPSYEDMETVRAAMNKLCQILFQLNAIQVYPGISGSLNILNHANQTGEVRALSPQAQYFKMDFAHQFGTCRIGDSPKDSVVTTNLKVHGTENLYCSDTSVLSDSSKENPTLRLKALALKVRHSITL